jgi:Ca2+-binding RTX toxin-like protein
MVLYLQGPRRLVGVTGRGLVVMGFGLWGRGVGLVAVLVVGGGLVGGGVAHGVAGSTVSLVATKGENVLWFSDAAGVVNDVTISFENGGAKVVDGAGSLVAGAGCVGVDARTVTCAKASPVQQIHLGNGNDRLLNHGSAGRGGVHYVYGDQGDDVVRDMATDGRIYGGPGNDALDIRGSRSSVVGGPGNDQLDGRKGFEVWLWGEGGDDVLVSGAGGKLYGEDGNDWLDGTNPSRPYGALVCDGGAGTNLIENCPP